MKISEFDISKLHEMSVTDLQQLRDELVTILSHGNCINVEETLGLVEKIESELSVR